MKRPSSDDETGSPSKQLKQECKYGTGCYQKNPAHLEKFCHTPATPASDNGVSNILIN